MQRSKNDFWVCLFILGVSRLDRAILRRTQNVVTP